MSDVAGTRLVDRYALLHFNVVTARTLISVPCSHASNEMKHTTLLEILFRLRDLAVFFSVSYDICGYITTFDSWDAEGFLSLCRMGASLCESGSLMVRALGTNEIAIQVP